MSKIFKYIKKIKIMCFYVKICIYLKVRALIITIIFINIIISINKIFFVTVILLLLVLLLLIQEKNSLNWESSPETLTFCAGMQITNHVPRLHRKQEVQD